MTGGRGGFHCAFGTMIPVLHARDVRHSVIVAIPSLEAVHAEQPESRAHIGEGHEAIVVPDVDAKCALFDAGRALPTVVGIAPESMLVLALTGEPVADRLWILRVGEIEHLQAVLVRRDEHVWPAYLVIVREIAPIGRPRTDRNVDVLRLAGLAG